LAASLYFVFSVLFGGVLLTARNSAITGIMYLSIINFGFQVCGAASLVLLVLPVHVVVARIPQILMINEFHGVRNINFNPQTQAGPSTAVVITGDTWLINWGINILNDKDLLMKCAAALVVYIVILLLLAYALLAYYQRYVK
jgi:hypothetical protein